MHVLLVHGLGHTALSLVSLARCLRRAGHTTESFGYVAAVESFERIATRLRSRLRHSAVPGRPYAVLGHSLGGLLLRHALEDVPVSPSQLIMLGTPNRPPRLARRARRWWLFRLATGDPGRRLSEPDFFRTLPVPAVPYTIIAGTAGPLGRFSPFGREPNDWVVAVSETRISDSDQPVLVSVPHTFLMFSSAVKAEVCRVLAREAA